MLKTEKSVRLRKMLPDAACAASVKKSNLLLVLLGVSGGVPAELGGLEPVLEKLDVRMRSCGLPVPIAAMLTGL